MRRVYLLIMFLVALTVTSQAQELNLYVSPLGNDAAEGSSSAPLRTVGRALELANDSATHIFVAGGSYTESHTLELRSNLTIEGSLNDSTWQPGSESSNILINTVEYVDDYSHKIGFRSDNDTNWLLKGINITVAAATDADRASSGKGATVYALHISGSAGGNQILDCELTAGNGGNGLNGNNGAAGTAGANGTGGGDGGLSPLTNSGTEVGTGGAASGSGARAGGRGGNGGAGGEGNENNGNGGNSGMTGGNGAGGNGGNGGGTTSPGQDGAAGAAGANGSNGTTVASGNSFEWLHYFVPAATGNNGTDGTGGGGGGGGAGGGSATGTTLLIPNQYCGGAGGGGGAGGTGGTGGTAGTAGGGSFGIYCASGQTPFILNTSIVTGNAGQGGNGGQGGIGGNGGNGGNGGSRSTTGTAGYGGKGGRGGNGGNGGDGENGCNGTALLIAVTNNAELVADNIATPNVDENHVCGGDDVSLNATPGFGGQTCQWFSIDNDSVPVATGTEFYVGNVTGTTQYLVATYDTVRDILSYERVMVTVYPSYYETDEVTIQESDLPYSYRDTVFEAGTETGEYTFSAITATGCDSILTLALTVVADDTTGVATHTIGAKDVTLFPNPANGGTVTVQYGAADGSQHLRMYDASGREVRTARLTSEYTFIRTEGLQKGLYTIHITSSDGQVTAKKLVIN